MIINAHSHWAAIRRITKDLEKKVKLARKKKRQTENNLYAKTARFWKGKIKSADRMFYDKPVNSAAVKEILKNKSIDYFEYNYKKLHD